MDISVIIPNYNSGNLLDKAIASIKNLKTREIIVVDNASVDGSAEKAGKTKGIKTIYLKKNFGASAARNAGIIEAKGSYLLFMDCDVRLEKGALTMMKKALDDGADIAFPNVVFESGEVFYPALPEEEEYSYISACFMIRKKSLSKIDGLFDESFETYLEDYDFFMRCRLSGLKAAFVRDAQAVHADKKQKGYSRRYFLETRNLIYGILKWRGCAQSGRTYNPFAVASLVKSFYCGIANFAWFDCQAYDRRSKKRRYDAKIQDAWPSNMILFFHAAISGFSMAGKAAGARKRLRNFYNLA